MLKHFIADASKRRFALPDKEDKEDTSPRSTILLSPHQANTPTSVDSVSMPPFGQSVFTRIVSIVEKDLNKPAIVVPQITMSHNSSIMTSPVVQSTDIFKRYNDKLIARLLSPSQTDWSSEIKMFVQLNESNFRVAAEKQLLGFKIEGSIVGEDMLCGICKCLMYDPVIVSNCGCPNSNDKQPGKLDLCCRECIPNNQVRCGECKQFFQTVISHPVFQRLTMNEQVKCIACESTVPVGNSNLQNLVSHYYTSMDGCKLVCDLCADPIALQCFSDHRSNCETSIVPCPFAESVKSFDASAIPFYCTFAGTRSELQQHLQVNRCDKLQQVFEAGLNVRTTSSTQDHQEQQEQQEQEEQQTTESKDNAAVRTFNNLEAIPLVNSQTAMQAYKLKAIYAVHYTDRQVSSPFTIRIAIQDDDHAFVDWTGLCNCWDENREYQNRDFQKFVLSAHRATMSLPRVDRPDQTEHDVSMISIEGVEKDFLVNYCRVSYLDTAAVYKQWVKQMLVPLIHHLCSKSSKEEDQEGEDNQHNNNQHNNQPDQEMKEGQDQDMKDEQDDPIDEHNTTLHFNKTDVRISVFQGRAFIVWIDICRLLGISGHSSRNRYLLDAVARTEIAQFAQGKPNANKPYQVTHRGLSALLCVRSSTAFYQRLQDPEVRRFLEQTVIPQMKLLEPSTSNPSNQSNNNHQNSNSKNDNNNLNSKPASSKKRKAPLKHLSQAETIARVNQWVNSLNDDVVLNGLSSIEVASMFENETGIACPKLSHDTPNARYLITQGMNGNRSNLFPTAYYTAHGTVMPRSEAKQEEIDHKTSRTNGNKKQKQDRECLNCNTTHSKNVVLICDGCEGEYHLRCLGLRRTPETDKWYCSTCVDHNNN